MPPTFCGNLVDDVEVEQLDPVLREAFSQRVGQTAEFVVAQPASGALGVDHDRDRGVRAGSGGHPGNVADGLEQLGRKVNAHNAAHLPTVDGHQNKGLFGDEPQNGG